MLNIIIRGTWYVCLMGVCESHQKQVCLWWHSFICIIGFSKYFVAWFVILWYNNAIEIQPFWNEIYQFYLVQLIYFIKDHLKFSTFRWGHGKNCQRFILLANLWQCYTLIISPSVWSVIYSYQTAMLAPTNNFYRTSSM